MGIYVLRTYMYLGVCCVITNECLSLEWCLLSAVDFVGYVHGFDKYIAL